MLKKIDHLVLKAFLGPFAITFFVAFFILLMQSLWKYIDDLVGKGLDIGTILQFVWYSGATLSALAMPIAILISSIMTFGNLGESFELGAAKASGISLLRMMRPLFFFTLVMAIITFLFANYVIPYSNYKFYNLYREILVRKPAFDLQEGVFYNRIPGYSIRVSEKDADGAHIKNVLIYEAGGSTQDNTILAKRGLMQIAEDKGSLAFNLNDGVRYQERGEYNDSTTEFMRMKFKSFKKLFDISVLQQHAEEDSTLRNNVKMFSARQLSKHLDSLRQDKDSVAVVQRGQMMSVVRLNDTAGKSSRPKLLSRKAGKIPDSLVSTVNDRALAQLSTLKNTLQMSKSEMKTRGEMIDLTEIEWHRKYAFSCICLVLFLIGAPLGSIVRKGGLGMPLVLAITFFLIYHLLNMFGERLARNGFMPPWAGMWLAAMVLTPVGIFFTYKAMHDSQLFNKEFYYRLFRRKKQTPLPVKATA